MGSIIDLKITHMTSREIAELTGKRHPDVKRDIKNICKDLDIDVSSFAQTYIDASNRQQTEYKLDKHYTLVLVTGYSAKLRDIVLKRWQYLEDQLKALQTRSLSKKKQIDAMAELQHLLPEEFKQENVSYIKANTVVNKATSNFFGFPKMLKKDEMNADMIEIRDKCLDDYIKLFEVLEDNGKVKDILYQKYQQRLIDK